MAKDVNINISGSCKGYEKSKTQTLNYLFWVLILSVIVWVIVYIVIWWFPLLVTTLNVIMMVLSVIAVILIVLWKVKSRKCEH